VSSKRDIQPYWRPDFKIQSTLPDIKVVRTDFIINFIAVALMLIAVFTLLQREYRAYSLRSSIAGMERRIRVSEVDDNLYLKESERFRKSAQSVEDLQRFSRAPFTPHELLAELSLLKPEGLIFSRMVLTESVSSRKGKGRGKAAAKPQVAYAIRITGDVQGLPILTQFKGVLQASPSLNLEGFEVMVDESIQQRNASTGITPFQVSISLTPETAPAASKGGKG
jgi:hypothetical protein